MDINQDPQDHSTNFQTKMNKILENFLGQCEQLENLIFYELREAENKCFALALELQQKSQQQMNVLERSKLKDLQGEFERKKSKITELKSFVTQVQQFQDDQVYSLEQYFVESHNSHPLVKIDSQQQLDVGSQLNNETVLIQQLYLQIQDLQIKIKNLELDVQMKGIYQQQLNEMTERNLKLEVAHIKKQKDYEQLIQERTKLQDINKKLQNELNIHVCKSKNLQLELQTISSKENQASYIVPKQNQKDLIDSPLSQRTISNNECISNVEKDLQENTNDNFNIDFEELQVNQQIKTCRDPSIIDQNNQQELQNNRVTQERIDQQISEAEENYAKQTQSEVEEKKIEFLQEWEVLLNYRVITTFPTRKVSGWLGAKLNKEDQIKYKGLVTSTKLCQGVEKISQNEQRSKVATGNSAVFLFNIENRTEDNQTGSQCQLVSLNDQTFRQSRQFPFVLEKLQGITLEIQAFVPPAYMQPYLVLDFCMIDNFDKKRFGQNLRIIIEVFRGIYQPIIQSQVQLPWLQIQQPEKQNIPLIKIPQQKQAEQPKLIEEEEMNQVAFEMVNQGYGDFLACLQMLKQCKGDRDLAQKKLLRIAVSW